MLVSNYRILGPKLLPEYEYWFRAKDKRYADYDPWAEFEQPSTSHLAIEIEPYIVVRHTPKGVFLKPWIGAQIFVLGNAIRQVAVPTIELALQDLVARKKKHAEMSWLRFARAEEHLRAAEYLLEIEREKRNEPC